MFKYSIFTLAVLALLCCGTFISVYAQTNQTKTIRSVQLDKTQVVRMCATNEEYRPKEGKIACSKEGSQVNIFTEIANSDDEKLEYYYIVSSGRIIGRGKKEQEVYLLKLQRNPKITKL